MVGFRNKGRKCLKMIVIIIIIILNTPKKGLGLSYILITALFLLIIKMFLLLDILRIQ